MTTQGTLGLDCIAADPYSRFLYGIGSAGSVNQFMQEDNRYTESTIFLVRSNASPTNLSTASWTVVSSVRGNDYSYNYPTFTSVDCATNGRGDFTAFFRSPYRTVSPAKLLPMGLRYDPDYDSWTAIQGTSLHGWTSDECLHKSFYTHPESPAVFHLLTSPEAYKTIFGRVDPRKFLLIPESSQDSLIGSIVQNGVDAGVMSHSGYDYTKRGFFSPTGLFYSRFITYHRDTFYFSDYNSGGTETDNCLSIPTVLSKTGLLGKSCTFRSPSIKGREPYQHHTFGGDRNGTTFFGGIYEIDSVLKIYTTENVTDRTYLEYPLIRTDLSSDFVVDRNFQVVGGLAPGQEPFVVALTSVGLYQFTIFGPGAGTMSGPYKVEITEPVYSEPHRVVRTMKDRVPSATSYGEYTKRVIGGSVAAVLVVLVIGGLFWWRRRTQRKRRILKDQEEGKEKEKDVGSDSEDPAPGFVGKHELHSMGLIPESESESSSSVHRTSQETSIDQPTATTPTTIITGRPRIDGRLPSYTSQDHIRKLDFSSHPRPNIVTLVGDREH